MLLQTTDVLSRFRFLDAETLFGLLSSVNCVLGFAAPSINGLILEDVR